MPLNSLANTEKPVTLPTQVTFLRKETFLLFKNATAVIIGWGHSENTLRKEGLKKACLSLKRPKQALQEQGLSSSLRPKESVV